MSSVRMSRAIRRCVLTLCLYACTAGLHTVSAQPVTYDVAQPGAWFDGVTTDKARYAPGETVAITITFRQPPTGKSLVIRYRHLFETVAESVQVPLSSLQYTWSWTAPGTDFTGYLVESFLLDDTTALDHVNIAVDVSSDWRVFPRYGFLSKFGAMDAGEIDAIVTRLNRFHINGLQFYDWHNKHHKPLAGTPEFPAATWIDVANRTNHRETIVDYLESADRHNMTAMAYNLLYGAWADAELDGVSAQWYLYQDAALQTRDVHPLPSSWASDIYVMDPGNAGWTDYLLTQMADVFESLTFDGWHVDQLGDRGTLWNAQGSPVQLDSAFETFLKAAGDRLGVRLVMNAVNQYGQSGIVNSPVEFLYTEVWDPNNLFSELRSILVYNEEVLGRKTVIAGYVNRGLSGRPGQFNTPGVLFADAVIFAHGGAHLEMGEHMLANEYFPNDNLEMPPELHAQLVAYYDVLVAYENLLRDDAQYAGLDVSAPGFSISGTPRSGSILRIARERSGQQILHLLNFTDVTTMEWRDTFGTQVIPATLTGIELKLSTDKSIKRVWAASPDVYQGSPVELSFNQAGTEVTLTLPSLKYWSMIVFEEKEETTSIVPEPRPRISAEPQLDIFPTPFSTSTTIQVRLPEPSEMNLAIFSIQGRKVATLVNGFFPAGNYHFDWDAGGRASGVYIYRLMTIGHTKTGLLTLVR